MSQQCQKTPGVDNAQNRQKDENAPNRQKDENAQKRHGALNAKNRHFTNAMQQILPQKLVYKNAYNRH